jgi:hypothetical protein
VITESASRVLRLSVSLVVALLSGFGRHSGRPLTVAEPARPIPLPVADFSAMLFGRPVPAADASRAPPALHA